MKESCLQIKYKWVVRCIFLFNKSVCLGLNCLRICVSIALVGLPFCSGFASLRLSCENTDLYGRNRLNQQESYGGDHASLAI